MISVVMVTLNEGERLARALADLVPAAMDGLVREVILADGGSSDVTLEIAEEAGARVTAGGGLAGACAAAKSDWLLVLPPWPVLADGWRGGVADHVEAHRGAVGLLKPVRRVLWRRPGGVLTPKARYEASGTDGQTISGLARRLGAPSRTLRVLVSDPGGRR